ncbi:hypothetical protein BLOT_011015 [Blomia tropicalis]|nr:hypothetical protein BLOT_011015 [Blomia tropicalis]
MNNEEEGGVEDGTNEANNQLDGRKMTQIVSMIGILTIAVFVMGIFFLTCYKVFNKKTKKTVKTETTDSSPKKNKKKKKKDLSNN